MRQHRNPDEAISSLCWRLLGADKHCPRNTCTWRKCRCDMSVIQERVPAGAAEVMHYHKSACQFFYILEGEGIMIFEEQEVTLKKGQGIEIAPQVKHQFKNQSNASVHFLVISVPPTKGDRINV